MYTTRNLALALMLLLPLPADAESVFYGDSTICFREGLLSGHGNRAGTVMQQGWCKEIPHHTLDYSNKELQELFEVWEDLWRANSLLNKRLYRYTLEIVNDTSEEVIVGSANVDILTSPYYEMTRALQYVIPACTTLHASFISPWAPIDVVNPDFYIGAWLDNPRSPQATLRRMWVVGGPLMGDMPLPINPLYYFSEGLTYEKILPEKAESLACKG